MSRSQAEEKKPVTVKVVLLGKLGVGKSAMTVRFLTKRYIGEYDPNIGSVYQHTIKSDKQTINIEILDSGGEDCLGKKESCSLWGDAFLLVYAINDRDSFNKIIPIQEHLHTIRAQDPPTVALVGNKSDLEDQRRVQTSEAQNLADLFDCSFTEISTLESFKDVERVFRDVVEKVAQEKTARQVMSGVKKGSFSKIKDMMDKHIARKRANSSLKETIDEYYVRRSHQEIEPVIRRQRSDTCTF